MSPLPARPWLVAHRGDMREAPQNTRIAFDRALAAGVDGIELDVQLTRDDVPVLHHDGNLRKHLGTNRAIADFDYADLAERDWGGWFHPRFAGTRVMTLDNLLDEYAAKTRLLIEIKTFRRDRTRDRWQRITRTSLATIRAATTRATRNNVFVLSFDVEVLSLALQLEPSWKYVLNTNHPETLRRRPPGVLPHLAALCAPIRKQSSAFVRWAHQQSKMVMTWSCNVPRQVRRANDVGVDVIMSDRPGWIVPFVKGAEREA